MQDNQEIIEELQERNNIHKEEIEEQIEEVIETNKKWINESTKNAIENISKQLNNLGVNPEINEKYLDLVDKFNDLSKYLGEIGDSKLDKQKHENVLKHYQDVSDVMDEFSAYENDETYKQFFTHFDELKKCVSADIRSLIKMKEPQTISEISQNGRKRTIDITGQNVDKVGANMSSRQIIKDGNDKKVFTQSEVYDFDKAMKENHDRMCQEYPQYVDFFKTLNNPNLYKNTLVYPELIFMDNETHVLPSIMIDNIFDRYYSVYDKHINSKTTSQINKDKFKKEKNEVKKFQSKIKSAISDDNILEVALHDYFNGMFKIANQREFNKVLDTKNDPIDERNSGMSVVAELLGIGNVICHSEPVTIKDGDKEIDGTLMNFSNGTDVNNISIDDPIANYDSDEIAVTPEANKQIADVQVLDYICGNLDRHAGNLFMKYDTSDIDHPKLVGVEGIDNDCSFFGKKGVNYIENKDKMVGLSNLRLIDKTTAERIKLVTPAMLKIALQGLKIGKEAIDNTIERFTALQGVLRDNTKTKEVNVYRDVDNLKYSKKIEDVKINVVNGLEAWDKINVNSINYKYALKRNMTPEQKEDMKKNRNLFQQTYEINSGKDNLEYTDPQKTKIYEAKKSLFKSRVKSRENIKRNTKNLSDKSKLFRSSGEYRAVQNALKAVKKAEANITINSDARAYRDYKNKLETLKTKTDLYLAKKSRQEAAGEKFSEYTNNRIQAVREIKDMIDQRCAEYDEKTNELESKVSILKAREDKIKDFTNQKNLRNLDKTARLVQKLKAEAAKQKLEENKRLHQNLKEQFKDVEVSNTRENKSEVVIKKENDKKIETNRKSKM